MKYQGTVYAFDLDDTLVWSPHWYDEAVVDSEGYVVAPGRSPGLKGALDFIEHAEDQNIPERFKGMKLQMEESDQLDGKNTFFLLMGSDGSPVSMSDLRGYFTEAELDQSSLTGPSRHTKYAAVADDNPYYHNLDTIGALGFNREITDLYEKHRENSIVLTARINIPGMNQRIHKVISKELGAPKAIFTQPPDSRNSGRYKGEIIAGIASQPDVDHVHFYDDNLSYIQGAQKVVDMANLTHKVTMHHAHPKNKPTTALQKIVEMVKMANRLDNKRQTKQADLMDRKIKEAVDDL